jgi:hypothetical protein
MDEELTFTEWLDAELAGSYCQALQDAGLPAPTPADLRKVAAYVEVPHELLVDSGGHVCDNNTCPAPEPDLPPLPWRWMLRYRARRVWWAVKRVPGLRLVHKDRIDLDDSE